MAIGIQNLTNIDTTDPTNYPNGNLKDDPAGVNGTPLNVESLADIFQTFDRSLAQAGITASGNPDNVGNTYQYAKAFGLEAWTNLGTTLTVAADTGSFTVAAGDIIYNRYQLIGRTFRWQIQLRTVTVASSPNIMVLTLPAAITGAGLTFVNDLGIQSNSYDQSANKLCISTFNVSGGYGTDKILIQHADGTAFTNGTNDQVYHINIEVELE